MNLLDCSIIFFVDLVPINRVLWMQVVVREIRSVERRINQKLLHVMCIVSMTTHIVRPEYSQSSELCIETPTQVCLEPGIDCEYQCGQIRHQLLEEGAWFTK